MTTILIILAAIAVVVVCLETTKTYESTFYEAGTLRKSYQDRGSHVYIWDGYGYYDSLAAPFDLISGDENLSNGDDLLPGGTTYELNHIIGIDDD